MNEALKESIDKAYEWDKERFLDHGYLVHDLKDAEARSYLMMLLYHGLEKSLSLKERSPDHGWGRAREVLDALRIVNQQKTFGYHDSAAKSCLKAFCLHPLNRDREESKQILEELDALSNIPWGSENHGGRFVSKDFLEKGKIPSPEDFFESRKSIREYALKAITQEDWDRVFALANWAPSSCNRQMWRTYYTDDPKVIRKALELQNGNAGFADKIPNLVVIAQDLRGLLYDRERNQQWVNGGIYLMALIYAMHSVGIGSCILNWSATREQDDALREMFNIRPEDTVITMLACGYPDVENGICCSERLPWESRVVRLTERQ